MKLNRAIIIGGGSSIRQNLWSTPINQLPIWKAIKDEFTIGTNFSYKFFDSTVLMYSDYQFYGANKKDLKNVSLILGKEDGEYKREDGIRIDNNVVLLKECESKSKIIWGENKAGMHAHYWGKDAWTKGFYCYDKETEILTSEGWKYFKDLNKTEKIATLNIQKNIVEYQIPSKYIKDFYSGQLIHEKSKRIDLLVTPNHKMYLKIGHHRNKYNYFFESADCLEKHKEILYQTGFPFNGNFKKWFILPALKHKKIRYSKPCRNILMNDWLEFLGWYLSEGWCGHMKKGNYLTVISQSESKNPENCVKIKNIIKKCGFHFYEAKTNTCINYTIHSKQLYLYLKQFGKAKDKFISREFLNLNKQQLNILLQTLILGDGSINKKSKQIIYFTSSSQLANDVCELALKIGYTPYLTSRKSGFINSLGYVININKTKTALISNHKRPKINYNDYVYCVEVPNHLIYVRRNGHSCWSGNSSQLIGIKALNLAIALGYKEIYLLGFDATAINGHTHFYDDTNVGQYIWKTSKHDGVGKDENENYKTGNYNKIYELNFRWFQPFEQELQNGIKIYNVSLHSKILTFPKRIYKTFYEVLQNKENINQEEIRQLIRNKL